VTRDNRGYYDAFAAGYDRDRDRGYHRLVDDLEAEVARPYVTGRHVLEAGCGTGLLLDRLAQDASGVVGVDLSRGMVSRALERGHPVVQADLAALPFADASFDAVASFKVLAHVPEPRRAIAELGRVLRPGGHLVLEFYNRHSLRHLIRALRPSLRTSDAFAEDAIATRFVSPHEAVNLLPEGFEVVDLRGIRGFTLLPATLRLPLLGRALQAAERRFTWSRATRLGGFLIVVARKPA
jgi:ubiquinone/menaquinone biosynthesis C-methylase UbiE